MVHQKIINFLDNKPNQPTKYRTKDWVELNDDSRGTCNTNSQFKFKSLKLRSSLCNYSDAYILVGGTIKVAALTAGGGKNDIQVIFENCAAFTNCISETNNTQIDNAKGIDVVMPMYNLIEYGDNYSKILGSLWQYYRDESALTNADVLDNYPGNSASFKFNQKITGSTGDDGTKAVQMIVPLKYVSNFCRTLEMPLINCEINFILTWSANRVIPCAVAGQATTFAITNTKLYVPVVTLSTQESGKLLQQLKSGFRHTINWNKYHLKTELLNAPNPYLDFLIDPSFQGVNRLFVLPFNALDDRTGHSDIIFQLQKQKTIMLSLIEKTIINQLKII